MVCEACQHEIPANYHRVTLGGVEHFFHDVCGEAAMRLYRRGGAIRFIYARPEGVPRHSVEDGLGDKNDKRRKNRRLSNG
jgi:hypothetical protein